MRMDESPFFIDKQGVLSRAPLKNRLSIEDMELLYSLECGAST